jgi:superfamily II DNA or RNA helicase
MSLPDVSAALRREDGDTSFLAEAALLSAGPRAFLRAIERLLLYLGYDDIRNIDGPGDEGGDILAHRLGLRWVFQSKWTTGRTIAKDAVRQVDAAKTFYGADRAVVVTNARPGRAAIAHRQRLLSVGVRIDFWDAPVLAKFANRIIPRYVPGRFEPYPYQAEAISAALRALETTSRAMAILATGLGKTVVAGEVVHDHVSARSDAEVLVVAHTKDLVRQLERAMWRHLPRDVPTRLLTGDDRSPSPLGVTCATVESALRALQRGWRPTFVVVDEAHHVAESGMFEQLLALAPETPRLGMTATPWRGDRYDIAEAFGEPVFRMGIADGMAAGFLSQMDYRLYLDQIDWDAVREASEHGLSLGDLNHRLFLPQRDEAVLEKLRAAWNQTLEPRAIVFCRTIDHAEELAQELREEGWRRAECVSSRQNHRERDILMSQFRDGRVPIVTTVDLLNEGVDVPDVNLICFLRVTHSRRIFVQQLGRGLRLRDGKEKVTVLDFVSDIRRIRATLDLRTALERLEPDEIERLRLERSTISFSNPEIGSFLEEWIRDAASLEDTADEVRLQFPEVPGWSRD